GIKKIGLFIFAMFMFLFAIVMACTPLMVLSDKDEEILVDHKYSSKGLYFNLHYHVASEDGASPKVSKGKFSELQIGDTYIYSKENSIKDALLMGLIAIPFALFIIWFVWVLLSGIFAQTRLIQWIHKKEEKISNNKKFATFAKYVGETVIVLMIVASVVIYSFVGRNIFYKINPIGKSLVQAEILDKEKEITSAGKAGIRETNTFTLEYGDQSGTSYRTEKDVSSLTYDTYSEGEEIDINYRNQNPYDTFIHFHSIKEAFSEMFSLLLRVDSIAMILFIYVDYYFIKRYIKKWKSR